MERCHDIFKQTMATKERPMFRGREIKFPLHWIEYKAEIFWHSASIEQKIQLDIMPCNNDISSFYCGKNCIEGKYPITMGNGEVRAKCIYRALRIGWIKELVDLYNEEYPRVKYWEKESVRQNKKRKRLYLRYQEEELDYMVVMEEKDEKRVQFITAYLVFYISAKNDYEKDYLKEQKKLITDYVQST